MKVLLVWLLIAFCISAGAQPKILDHAYIITKATLKLADTRENANNNTFSTLGGSTTHLHSINGMTEGYNRIITYYKGDKIKVVNDINMGTNTIIIDRKNRKAITLVEVMGVRTGFYTTEENAKQMKGVADSLNKINHHSFNKNVSDSSIKFMRDSLNIKINYYDDSKLIAGFNCKRAEIKMKHFNGSVDSMSVWYCPEFKFKPDFNSPTGIISGLGIASFDFLNGFPMKYEATDIWGNKVKIEVKKIDVNKEIKDKEFDVPNGYELKPMTPFIVEQHSLN